MNQSDQEITFGTSPLGSRFQFHGRTFTKIARNMSHDEHCTGTIFMDEAIVGVRDPPAEGAV